MSRKKQLEYRRNCSNRNMGKNDSTLYLAVDIQFEQLLHGCAQLMRIVLLSLVPKQSTVSVGPSSSNRSVTVATRPRTRALNIGGDCPRTFAIYAYSCDEELPNENSFRSFRCDIYAKIVPFLI